jgi:hypothetical protein
MSLWPKTVVTPASEALIDDSAAAPRYSMVCAHGHALRLSLTD